MSNIFKNIFKEIVINCARQTMSSDVANQENIAWWSNLLSITNAFELNSFKEIFCYFARILPFNSSIFSELEYISSISR